jgi:hypothetical protein
MQDLQDTINSAHEKAKGQGLEGKERVWDLCAKVGSC